MFKKQIDFRHNPRHEVHLSVEFTGDQLSGKGLVCNLSRSGCCIRGDTRVPVGAFVELEINLPDASTPLIIDLGVVRWSAGERFGIDFLQLKESETRRLKQFLTTL
ncbi:MAG: PilZ domain-containing protein [Nitrospiraceae bacterium]